MRYFKLENSERGEFDITTDEVLFHDIEGLGFEEETDFRRVGPVWRLNTAKNSQLPVSGKLCFTENGSTTPYRKYEEFKKFITRTPLILKYYPHGVDDKVYRKRVRVNKLAKTEMTKYGVLDCEISFMPYSPWYEVITLNTEPIPVSENAGWIWDVGNRWDRPDSELLLPRYKFGSETRSSVYIDCDSNTQGFVKLEIIGPARKPNWNHYVNGKLVSSGGFESSSDVSLTENEHLIVDNTEGLYSMVIRNVLDGSTRNVYSLRDFDKLCFFNLEAGRNVITVSSENGTPLTVIVESHIHYATV